LLVIGLVSVVCLVAFFSPEFRTHSADYLKKRLNRQSGTIVSSKMDTAYFSHTSINVLLWIAAVYCLNSTIQTYYTFTI